MGIRMKENLNIKVVHEQIQRLRPELNKIIKEIDVDTKNPKFAEFVVRNNADEKYLIKIINELLAMYDAYLKATTKTISEGMAEEDDELS